MFNNLQRVTINCDYKSKYQDYTVFKQLLPYCLVVVVSLFQTLDPYKETNTTVIYNIKIQYQVQ